MRRLLAGFQVPQHAVAWTIYLAVLAIQPAFESGPYGVGWLLAAAMAAAFLPIYSWTIRNLERRPYLWQRRPGAVFGVASIVALGLAGVMVNSGASVFFVFASTLSGRIRPRRRAHLLIVGVTLSVLAVGALSPISLPYRLIAFVPVLVLTPVLGLASVYEAERSQTNERLRMAHDEIERLAAFAERERIARDLHDLLGHTLSTITLKSELASRLAEQDTPRAVREIRDIEKISRGALAEVRSAVRGYRDGGLQGELANAKLALEAAGVDLDHSLANLALRPEAESVVALALREAVTNVVRHAHARTCRVVLEADGPWLRLVVEDDGEGRPDAQLRDAGHGLEAMRERVRGLGGQVTLQPSRAAASSGTRLELTLPLTRAVPAQAPA